MTRVLVVGAGWAGAVAAHQLDQAGQDVVAVEATGRVGGRSRAEVLEGAVHEPIGVHIFGMRRHHAGAAS